MGADIKTWAETASEGGGTMTQAEIRAKLKAATELLHLYYRRSQLSRPRLLGLVNEWEKLVELGRTPEAQGIRMTFENAAGFHDGGKWHGLAEFRQAVESVEQLSPAVHSYGRSSPRKER